MNAGELFRLEKESLKDGFLHHLDPRVKLLSALTIILAAVFLGRREVELEGKLLFLILVELYLLALALISKLDLGLYISRVAIILPFAGSIAFLKPFIEPGEVLFSLGVVDVSSQGLEEGVNLLAIVVVSISSVILLSSTTRIGQLASALRSLKLPPEFSLLLAMTFRFLFYYAESFQRIMEAQRNRGFSIRNPRVSRSHTFRTIGYTIAMIFVGAHKQGMNTYQAMLSRGYQGRVKGVGSGLKPRDWGLGLVNLVLLGLFASLSTAV